jgi:hypothetical protein
MAVSQLPEHPRGPRPRTVGPRMMRLGSRPAGGRQDKRHDQRSERQSLGNVQILQHRCGEVAP